ncbi:ferredoxin reductase [Rudaeicoccus suwonensis]|uniref:Ferredoxin-NADP reductase n=1 Tax=Rudaeicoccus suwonensis TaxID=657409 RepID=A0A561E3G1_9MICO|nr:ferredoxin reductase [Rudaeicoccus suwonensis]TWE10153.1 ferredoxin-NADP reductase [Rudaeicoccus suwonensis]
MKSVALRAAAVFTHPAPPHDFISLFNPLSSARQMRGVVSAVRAETTQSTTIAFRPGQGWSPHDAGQWARIGVEIDGVRQWRSYSLSAAAGQDPEITVTACGKVSSHLAHHTRVGDVFFLAPPQGDFVLPSGPRPLLMLTAGSGITPVMSMIRTLIPRRNDADVVLLHSARTRESALFCDELANLSARHPGLHVVHRITSEQGRIDLSSTADLDAICPDWRSRKTYVCGPTDMLDAATQLWHDADLPESLTVERFAVATLPAVPGTGGRITFERSDREVESDGATTLLEVGEEAGILMPSGCRMGICRTCLTPLLSGQVRDLRTGEIHSNEGDLIQTCISAAAGDCHLDR